MKHIPWLGVLALVTLPLAAQRPQSGAPTCSVTGAPAPGAEGPLEQCGTMQPSGCPMMQGRMGGMMQGGAQGGMMHGRMGGGADAEPALAPIREAMTFCPSRILARKDELELTAQQEAKLTELLEAGQRAIEAAQADAQKESDALARALRASKPDVKEVERRFRALHAALGTAHLVRLRTTIEARAVLTDEQREGIRALGAAAAGTGRHGSACGARGDIY